MRATTQPSLHRKLPMSGLAKAELSFQPIVPVTVIAAATPRVAESGEPVVVEPNMPSSRTVLLVAVLGAYIRATGTEISQPANQGVAND